MVSFFEDIIIYWPPMRMSFNGFQMTTIAEIATLSSVGVQCEELSALQIAAGFVTWMNVLKVFAVVLGATCFTFLFGRFVFRLLAVFASMPVLVYEFLGFTTAVALLILPAWVGISDPTWFIVPGGILWAGTLSLAGKLRKRPMTPAAFFAAITVLWAAVAVYYGNHVVGFGAVASFMAFMGFSIAVSPLAYSIGFDDEKAVNRAGGAGLFITAALVGERWIASNQIDFGVFREGMLWLGPFVFALSVLINSSRWYMDTGRQSWIGMQMMAVAAYFALIMAGSVFRIDAVLNVGTAFMILYLVEKPFEVKHRSLTALAGTGLAVSLAVGAAVYWAQSHPETIAAWLPLLAR